MAGRRPIPDEIKRLTGSHNPLNPDSPVFRSVDTAKKLRVVERDQYASEEWDRLVPELVNQGLLTRAGLSYFGAYCMSFSQWQHAEDDITEHGRLIFEEQFDKKGNQIGTKQYLNPALLQAREAMKLMLRIGTEFGLTPSAATRVKANQVEVKKSSFRDMINDQDEDEMVTN